MLEDEENINLKKVSKRNEATALCQISLSALLFGISFVYQRYAMIRGIGPVTFNACRFTISTFLTLIMQCLIQSKISITRDEWRWGIFCGIFVFGGSVFQQIGLKTIQAAKMSLITGSYVIFVPAVEWLIPGFGVQLNWRIWMSAAVSLVGFFLLSGCSNVNCFHEQDSLMKGEVFVFISMLLWIVVVMATDIASKKVDCISLAIVEDIVCSILSLIAALFLEDIMWDYPYKVILESWDLILIVAAVEGSAVVFGILGQKYINPSLTALISSSASVYTAIFGYYFLHETLNPIEFVGCALILIATLFASYRIDDEKSSEIPGDKIMYGSI
jgi:drug/metabolite transporter (DMT)-like permease